jgi:hypothetical protein
MDMGDYDGSGPIYYAIRGKKTEVVKYLLDLNVDMNILDRWGGSALNYAKKGSEIEKMLEAKGALRGKDQSDLRPMIEMNLSDDDLRLFFAAGQGNLDVIKTLFH